ncbi:succinate dehydrogenase cytochrome b560 subunit [Plectosphaerella plurivora]|uniref:Succinate dehydrogenase cytochrome b560 subunit n=1 Tax=Plectosphaerella plurivora TaxID=936078 RepID=A0A9P8VI58_9PEZI|nr:succinate dehydrogenase cytochrome b560 subunit [Plectosphaerella plurivora]
MIAQRVGVSAARRAVAGSPVSFLTRQAPKVALSTSQTRPVATNKISPDEARSLLASQRLSRPISPHLTIYRFDQTWLGASIWTRITGNTLSAAFYVYLGSYLVAPLMGWHVESASVAAAFGALPLAVKGTIKFLVAWPFTFHAINGVRHLFYDMAKGFSKKDIKNWGWGIWGASLVSGLYIGYLL